MKNHFQCNTRIELLLETKTKKNIQFNIKIEIIFTIDDAHLKCDCIERSV